MKAANKEIILSKGVVITYDQIRRLPAFEQNHHIMQSLARGISEDELAKTLGVHTKCVRRRVIVLRGSCPEVVELLKDQAVTPTVFEVLRKMTPSRQLAVADLMLATGNLTGAFAKAMLAASKQSDLAKPHIPKATSNLTATQMAHMAREMESLLRRFHICREPYADDALILVVALRHMTRLISNQRIARYLRTKHRAIFKKLVQLLSEPRIEGAYQPLVRRGYPVVKTGSH